MLNESTLVLEGVTLAEVVELVVEVLVNLAGSTVSHEQTAENTLTAHPEDVAARSKKKKTSEPLIPNYPQHDVVNRPAPRKQVGPETEKGFFFFFLHTWAYERPWYPYAYPSPCVCQYDGPDSAHGREHASA